MNSQSFTIDELRRRLCYPLSPVRAANLATFKEVLGLVPKKFTDNRGCAVLDRLRPGRRRCARPDAEMAADLRLVFDEFWSDGEGPVAMTGDLVLMDHNRRSHLRRLGLAGYTVVVLPSSSG